MTNRTNKLRKVLVHPVAKRLAVAAPVSVGIELLRAWLGTRCCPGTSCHRSDRDKFRLTPRGNVLLQKANATSQRRKAAEHSVPETHSVPIGLLHSGSW